MIPASWDKWALGVTEFYIMRKGIHYSPRSYATCFCFKIILDFLIIVFSSDVSFTTERIDSASRLF